MTLKRDQFIVFGIMFYIFAASSFLDGTSAIQASRLILVGIYIMAIITGGRLKINIYAIWLLLFALYSMLSCLYAYNTAVATAGAVTTFVNAASVISFLGLCLEVRHSNIRLILMKCLAVAPLFLGVYIFARHGIFCFINARNVMDVQMINANVIGQHSAIGFIMAFWLLTQKRYEKRFRWFYIIIAAIDVAFAALSASRKAIIILVLAIVLYFLFQSKSPLKFLGKVIIVIAGIVLLWLALTKIPFLYNLGGNRLEQMLNGFSMNEDMDGSTSFRMSLIQWGFNWFTQKPYFGYGADNFRCLVGGMHTWSGLGGTYAHNNFIEILVNLGLVGFVLYYSMYVKIIVRFIKSLRYKDLQKLIFGCVFLSVFINEYGMVTYLDKYMQIFYAIVWFVISRPNEGVVTVDQRTLSQRNCAVV